MGAMIKLRHQQPSLWTGILAEEIEDLWEPWMRAVDGLLEDEQPMDPKFSTEACSKAPESQFCSKTRTTPIDGNLSGSEGQRRQGWRFTNSPSWA